MATYGNFISRNEYLNKKLSELKDYNYFYDAIENTCDNKIRNLSEDYREGKKKLIIGQPAPSIEPYIENSTKALAKSATSEKIRLIQHNLSNLRKKGESREEYESSLNLLLQNRSQDRQVAHTFEDRVKIFETDIKEKNKQAVDFVKKM